MLNHQCKMLLVLLFFQFAVVKAQGPLPPPPPANDYFPAKWKDFYSADGGFKIRYPGNPRETSKTYESGGSTLTLHSFSYGNSSFIFYTVDYRDLPKAPINDAEVQKILVNAKENRLMGLEGKMKLIAEKATTRNGHPALYLELEYLQTKRLRELDVISGRRHYTVLVITFSNHGASAMGSENAYEKIANSFLESFQIVEASPLASSVR